MYLEARPAPCHSSVIKPLGLAEPPSRHALVLWAADTNEGTSSGPHSHPPALTDWPLPSSRFQYPSHFTQRPSCHFFLSWSPGQAFNPKCIQLPRALTRNRFVHLHLSYLLALCLQIISTASSWCPLTRSLRTRVRKLESPLPKHHPKSINKLQATLSRCRSLCLLLANWPMVCSFSWQSSPQSSSLRVADC